MVAVSDDDWFERAIDDDTEGAEGTNGADGADSADGGNDTGGPTDATSADTAREASGSDGTERRHADESDEPNEPDEPSGADELAFDAETVSAESEFDPETEAATASSERDASDAGLTTAETTDTESTEAAGASGSDGLFEEDFGAALQNVDVPDVGDGAGLDPEGFGDLDFGFDGEGDAEFDDEVESALPRIELGVEGLDRMIQGGVPERSLMVAIGSAGTGKTTFGLQFLNHGLEQGDPAVFIALEESRQRVLDSALEKGYAFDEFLADDRLAIVDLDPVEMTNSLASIRNELPRLVDEFGAERLVLDSVSLLEMMYDDRAKRRNEIYEFARGLKEAGVTALLTSEAAAENPYTSRHGIVEYLTDAVFVMQYVRPDDFRETRLAIEIQKIRDANHSREKKPYELTADGISVYQQANLF
ncbi:KaiC domain-containing protein [Halopiger aswanensis]|uniref:KaiC domain protein n=1 Tax=Halopiger aswanensis TaxID=148449 RepID=A0A3R7ED87_9EURY|nr:KaiC domain-containing protein [Halopiger aswanensis]RKD93416.1 KaiC domain protein [Halopiger aswanensis]